MTAHYRIKEAPDIVVKQGEMELGSLQKSQGCHLTGAATMSHVRE